MNSAGLDATGVSVVYGGHRAVDNVTLVAPQGRITGLIGPNGAGKTSFFNACSGLLRPADGTICLFGDDATRWSPAQRARRGLGRTFQRMEIVNAMTVRGNVALGSECRLVGSNPFSQLVTRSDQRRSIEVAAEEALEMCGIDHLADVTAGVLSTGQRRLVELARVLAGNFPILLLDEPSSGLDEEESDRFGEILQTAVRERGIGILLVEHDMDLVMGVCAHLYVLEFGRVIFEGAPTEVQASPLVRAAYLGSEAEGAA
jgi:ABC-type branched-subunit amino acid transport system ATPase component